MSDIVQGSDEWRRLRMGKVTGSRIADVMSKGKGGAESAGRRNYRTQLALELISEEPARDTFSNGHMQRGNELEPMARTAYEFVAGVDVAQICFVDHAEIERYGVSPDGLVGKDGLIQIKCPIPGIHIEYLLGEAVPTDYIKQMQAEMDCTGRQWNDFVSYCPEVPVSLQLFICRLHRDEKLIWEIRESVTLFNSDVDILAEKLRLRM